MTGRVIGRAALLASVVAAQAWAAPIETTMTVAPFGRVTLYEGRPSSGAVVVFVSGDGGWNQGVVNMARELAGDGALVVGVDIVRHLRTLNASDKTCEFPAAHFETLSKVVEKSRGGSAYRRPILVGYSSGATLVYATLAQAPPGTFLGAVSLGFCPDLALKKPLCKGYGITSRPAPKDRGVVVDPVTHLEQPWIALQGEIDRVCDAAAAKKFVADVPNGEVVSLPKVGHGFSVARNWLPQLKSAVARLVAADRPVVDLDASVADLPLIELPASSTGGLLAVLVSGDGGWAGIDKAIAGELAARGVPVVGISSLKYFWSARTPDGSATDLARVLRHYLGVWHRERVLLIGYSLGADVLPFMTSGLPRALRARVHGVVLLAPSREAQFEFHVTDWLGKASGARRYPVLPAVVSLEDLPVLCVAGEEERDSLCRDVDRAKVEVETIRGGHHFGGDYQRLAGVILARFGPRDP